MNMTIVGRSPIEVNDDDLLEVHTMLTHDLNQVGNGVCLYLGEARQRRVALLNRCNLAIESGDSDPKHNMLTWYGLYLAATFRS